MNAIDLNYNYCKGCGICIEFCPEKVFEYNKNGKPAIINIENCIGCMLCERRCPDFAIKVEVQNDR